MEKIQPSACSVANNEKGSPDTGHNVQNCPSAGRAPSKPPLGILTGPTAVGKTALSVALAKAVNGEIISADSMQVYRRMDVGSAKVRTEEMQWIRHHLIDVLDPDEDFNVVLFQKLAGLQGGGLVMFLLSVIAVAALLIGIIRYKKTNPPAPKNPPRAQVNGAQ